MPNEQVGPLLAKDFANQNILRLDDWFRNFNRASESLEKELGDLCLKSAIQRNQWLNVAFLISVGDLPGKTEQIFGLQDNNQSLAPALLQSLVHRRSESQLGLMSFLQERIRL